MHHGQEHGAMSPTMAGKHYGALGVSFVVMLILMYVIMFSMIYSLGEFIQNINFFYMALMMATPMTAIMPLMMGSMYPDRRLNLILYAGCALLFILALVGIRTQALVGNAQFLRSMIPHHSGAVLMCEKAKLSDAEIEMLCGRIIRSQTEEIDQMKRIMRRL
jgi:uncharacterized protein (DUF305 family)